MITQDEACLWTDGRYFVQAAKELAGTGVTLMKMGQEGVPTVEEYLAANTKEGMTIGFDGRVVNEMLGEALEKTLPERFLSYRSDLIGETGRTARHFPQNPCGSLMQNIPVNPLRSVLQKYAKR
mgnify:FL=1